MVISNYIDETVHAFLINLRINEEDWRCWIPKDILDENQNILDDKLSTVLIAKNYNTKLSTKEIKILAKYLYYYIK